MTIDAETITPEQALEEIWETPANCDGLESFVRYAHYIQSLAGAALHHDVAIDELTDILAEMEE